jgi:hypothetical protein
MAVVTVATGLDQTLGLPYTHITDDSNDWGNVPTDKYFYDKATKLVYYNNASGTVVSIFSSGGGNTIYTANDTVGTGRVATLTDTLTFKGADDLVTSSNIKIQNNSGTDLWDFRNDGDVYFGQNTKFEGGAYGLIFNRTTGANTLVLQYGGVNFAEFGSFIGFSNTVNLGEIGSANGLNNGLKIQGDRVRYYTSVNSAGVIHDIHADRFALFGQGFSTPSNSYFSIGSYTRLGTENISLQGSTLIKGTGTTTGTTLALYDDDTTPNKTWEWLDNGSITQYQNCIHTIDGTKNYSINKSSGDTALTIHGNANNKGLLSLTSAGARLIWNAGANTEILVGNGGASVKNGSWKIINSGGATLFDVGSNSSGKILSSASAWIRVMFNDTVVKVANLFIAFEVNTVEIARFTTNSLTMSKKIDMDNNRIINTVVNPSVQEATNSATFTINSDQETDGVLTAMSANTTIAAPTGTPVQSQDLVFRFKDDGTARTLTWNAIFRAIGVTLPTTTVANKLTYVGCKYNSTDSKWDVIAVQQEA